MTSGNNHLERAEIAAAVYHWINSVVIGLNLCPFASRPTARQQVHCYVSDARNEESLLADLRAELERMDAMHPDELETTLVIVPRLLGDFGDYNQFLDRVDQLLDQGRWTGIYQMASFHPQYQFADTAPQDAENLTNRAPYPILQIIREASIDKALEHFPDIDRIPENNIRRMNRLTDRQKQQLFPYLFGNAISRQLKGKNAESEPPLPEQPVPEQ